MKFRSFRDRLLSFPCLLRMSFNLPTLYFRIRRFKDSSEKIFNRIALFSCLILPFRLFMKYIVHNISITLLLQDEWKIDWLTTFVRDKSRNVERVLIQASVGRLDRNYH